MYHVYAHRYFLADGVKIIYVIARVQVVNLTACVIRQKCHVNVAVKNVLAVSAQMVELVMKLMENLIAGNFQFLYK